jgi:UDP-N-acetyl-D-mannosaminuronic acid dehydrogenase
LAAPGLTGGPCLFKDGFFLINDIPFVDLISTSWKINEALPLFLVGKVKERMSLGNKKAAILGAAFKANIDDTRESLSFKVKKALEREGARIFLHDPWVPDYNTDLEKLLEGANLVFVATNHGYYRKNLTVEKLKTLVGERCLICDVWNIFGTNKIIFPVDFLNE